MKRKIMFNVAVIILSVICIVLLFTVSAPCPSGMKCKATTQIEIGIIIGLIMTCLIDTMLILMDKHSLISRIIMITLKDLAIIGGYLAMFIMGWCKKLDMACNVKTAPTLKVFYAVILVVVTAGEFYERKKNVSG